MEKLHWSNRTLSSSQLLDIIRDGRTYDNLTKENRRIAQQFLHKMIICDNLPIVGAIMDSPYLRVYDPRDTRLVQAVHFGNNSNGAIILLIIRHPSCTNEMLNSKEKNALKQAVAIGMWKEHVRIILTDMRISKETFKNACGSKRFRVQEISMLLAQHELADGVDLCSFLHNQRQDHSICEFSVDLLKAVLARRPPTPIALEERQIGESLALYSAYNANPHAIRSALRRQCGLAQRDAADLFALVAFTADGYLTSSEPFFGLVARLPMELQMRACYLSVDLNQQNISSAVAEQAFRRLASTVGP